MINNEKKPVVSVIMNCLNCSEYLKEALDSVFAQTCKGWEIIFWDNGSSDNSFEIAKSYGPKAKCFRGQETYPLGKARNLALAQASGKFLAFLDCDDVWLPEKLEKQTSAFDADSKVGIVFSDAVYFNKKGDVFQLYGRKKPPENYAFRQLLKGNFLCMSSAVINKKALLSLNQWFDEKFNCIEDLDLFLRIAYEWKLKYVAGPLVKYRMHEKSLTYGRQSAFAKEGEILVEKLLDLYPNITKEYGREIESLQIRIGCQKFVSFWSGGNSKKARQHLQPFLMADKKLFLPYISSYFFPFSFFVLILRVFKRKTYSS